MSNDPKIIRGKISGGTTWYLDHDNEVVLDTKTHQHVWLKEFDIRTMLTTIQEKQHMTDRSRDLYARWMAAEEEVDQLRAEVKALTTEREAATSKECARIVAIIVTHSGAFIDYSTHFQVLRAIQEGNA